MVFSPDFRLFSWYTIGIPCGECRRTIIIFVDGGNIHAEGLNTCSTG